MIFRAASVCCHNGKGSRSSRNPMNKFREQICTLYMGVIHIASEKSSAEVMSTRLVGWFFKSLCQPFCFSAAMVYVLLIVGSYAVTSSRLERFHVAFCEALSIFFGLNK